MNTYDPQKAARVWQRVQNQTPQTAPAAPEESLNELIMEEGISAAAYQQLIRQMSGREVSLLQRLYRQEQAHSACLKGIYTLINGEKAAVSVPASLKESPELALRKCYGRHIRSLKAYEARVRDEEYGPVFAKLAEQEREHCRMVLEIIGGLQRK